MKRRHIKDPDPRKHSDSPKHNEVPREHLLQLLVRAICEEYKSDPTAPSVVLSFLVSGDFYASIIRFRGRFATDKYLVISAKGSSVQEAVTKLATEWEKNRSAVQTLADAVSSKHPRVFDPVVDGFWYPGKDTR